MSNIDNGGPAFPIPYDDRPHAYEAHPGMTLRDWFAGQALAGQLSDGAGVWPAKDCARFSYAFADAMIEARKVQP
jgi:hypothetical protein